MTQHDLNIANQFMPAARADINNAFEAVTKKQSGNTEPGTTKPFMEWADTANNIVKMRNSGDSAWISMYKTTGERLAPNGTIASPSYSFASDTDTGLFKSDDNKVGISTGGYESATHEKGKLAIKNDTHGANTVIELNAENDSGTQNTSEITYNPNLDEISFNKKVNFNASFIDEFGHFYLPENKSTSPTNPSYRFDSSGVSNWATVESNGVHLGSGALDSLILVNKPGYYLVNFLEISSKDAGATGSYNRHIYLSKRNTDDMGFSTIQYDGTNSEAGSLGFTGVYKFESNYGIQVVYDATNLSNKVVNIFGGVNFERPGGYKTQIFIKRISA